MTPTTHTFAAICGLTFACNRHALEYLTSKETTR